MRIKLLLNSKKYGEAPLNNRYELQAVLYRFMANSDSAFSEWLHNTGYRAEDNRRFKMFTFGNLEAKPSKIDYERKLIQSETGKWSVILSFYTPEGLEYIITGMFFNRTFELAARGIPPITFAIEGIEMEKKPEFQSIMKYRAVTPILMGEKKPDNPKMESYRSPEDPSFYSLFMNNVKGKVTAAGLEWREGVTDFQLSSNIKRKPVEIKGLRYIPYTFDFEFTAPKNYQEVMYYAGFGQDNASGLGFCEVM